MRPLLSSCHLLVVTIKETAHHVSYMHKTTAIWITLRVLGRKKNSSILFEYYGNWVPKYRNVGNGGKLWPILFFSFPKQKWCSA